MKIEPINKNDLPEFIEICRAVHKESRYKDWPFSEEMVAGMLASPFAIKCTRDNQIMGFYLGTISCMEFSPKKIGMQILFWVKPKYRGSSAFYLLIKAFLAWCDEQKAVPFIAPHFFEGNAKTYRMLEKLGLNEFGKIYSRLG